MKRPILALLLCRSLSLSAQDAPNADVLSYIESFRALAVDEMVRTRVPAAIKLAQGIIETQAGKSGLVTMSNNHFGIKCKSSWTGERVFHDDDEKGECFRKYATAEDSWRDHSDFLRSQPRYAGLFRLDPTDYAAWARGLKEAGYATNPRYSETLIRYIETYRLNEHTLSALARIQGLGIGTVEAAAVPAEPAAEVPGDSGRSTEETGNGTESRSSTAPAGPGYGQVFQVNGTPVVRAEAGTSLLALSERHGLRLSQLLEFNEMSEQSGILDRDRLLYLRRKPRKGAEDWHEADGRETLRDIAASQGVRLESLMEYNLLKESDIIAKGRRIHLRGPAPSDDDIPSDRESSPSAAVPAGSGTAIGKREAVPESPSQGNHILHTVQPGETLYGLSRRYGVDQGDIMRLNGLTSTVLRAGAVVRIPSK